MFSREDVKTALMGRAEGMSRREAGELVRAACPTLGGGDLFGLLERGFFHGRD